MKNFSSKKTVFILLLISAFFSFRFAIAAAIPVSVIAPLPLPVSAPSPLPVNVKNTIGGYSSNYWSQKPTDVTTPASYFLFSQSPSFNNSIINNLYFEHFLESLGKGTALKPDAPIVSDLTDLLTATSLNAYNAIGAAMAQYFPLPETHVMSSSSSQSSGSALFNFAKGKANSKTEKDDSSSKKPPLNSINHLNLSSLIGPIQYDTSRYNQTANARSFIKYLSDQYNPIVLIDFTKLISQPAVLTQALGMSNVQQYLYILRKMVANYSVGISDLTFLYDERVPQDTSKLLGSRFQNISQKQLPGNLQKKASPLALEQWMAMHRLTSVASGDGASNWVAQMENATPATLQRETVYLLAEMRYEMFQDRLIQERILATLAAQEMQNIRSGQLQSDLSNLQSTICNTALFSKNYACPAPASAEAPPTPTGQTQ